MEEGLWQTFPVGGHKIVLLADGSKVELNTQSVVRAAVDSKRRDVWLDSGEAYFDWANWFFGSLIGRLVLFGYTWALMQHMLGGLRHFMCDLGHGYEKNFSTKLAIATPIVAVALTVLIWVVGYLAR